MERHLPPRFLSNLFDPALVDPSFTDGGSGLGMEESSVYDGVDVGYGCDQGLISGLNCSDGSGGGGGGGDVIPQYEQV